MPRTSTVRSTLDRKRCSERVRRDPATKFSVHYRRGQRPGPFRYHLGERQTACPLPRAVAPLWSRLSRQGSHWPRFPSRAVVLGPARLFRMCLGRDCSVAFWSPLSRPIRSHVSCSARELSLLANLGTYVSEPTGHPVPALILRDYPTHNLSGPHPSKMHTMRNQHECD